MSHFTVLVIGENPEEQLAPFDGNINMPKYCTGEVSEKDLKRFTDYYKEKNVFFTDTVDLYRQKGNDWNSNAWKLHTDGTWHEYSTYNPNSKWDWYQLGGRWAGQFEIKEGVSYQKPNFSHGWEAKEIAEVVKKRRPDRALKKDIANLDEITSFAVVKDGKWYERGEMGWWAIVSNEKDENEWKQEFKKLLADLPEDTLLSMYDCHI